MAWSRLLTALLLAVLAGSPVHSAKGKNKNQAGEEPARPAVRYHDVVVRGNLAYLAQTRGFVIFDVSDPASPEKIGALDLPATVTGVTLHGDLALLAAGDNGLVTVDISDPVLPRLLHRYDTPASVHRIAVRGDIAYLAEDTRGLIVLDISNPIRPRRLSRVSTRNRVRDISLRGDLLATAEGTAGARLFDVGRPDLPREILTFGKSEGAMGVSLGHGNAVVAAGKRGMLVYRLDPDGAATPGGVHPGPGAVRNVAHHDGLAYASCGSAGLQIYDLEDPLAPRLVAGHVLPRSYPVGRTWKEGDILFVAADQAGLAVIDVSDITLPVTLVPRKKAIRVIFP